VECPIRHLLHRDTFREVVWQQARGVMCLPSEAKWPRCIAERLGAFGIVVQPQRSRPLRYHEVDAKEEEAR
jgi:hypothetical protein